MQLQRCIYNITPAISQVEVLDLVEGLEAEFPRFKVKCLTGASTTVIHVSCAGEAGPAQ